MTAAPGPDDRRFAERLAGRLAARGLDVPALIALESARPLARIAGHALVFLTPLLSAVLPADALGRTARLLDDRARLDVLIGALGRRSAPPRPEPPAR